MIRFPHYGGASKRLVVGIRKGVGVMKLLRTFSKRYCFRKAALCLVISCLFFRMLPLATLAGPKGKALGHSKLHGNPHSISVLTPINIKVNPAGIIVGTGGIKVNGTMPSISNTGTVTNPGGFVVNGHGAGGNGSATAVNYGNISSPHGKNSYDTANSRVNPAGIIVGTGGVKTNQIGSNGYLAMSSGEKVLFVQPGSNVLVEIDLGVKKLKNNGKNHISGQLLVLAAGDAFSGAIADIGSLASSLTVPDPIGAKGPNPVHGGRHPKKGDGNPGGGNGNGHWGEGNKGNGKGNIWTGNQGRGVGEGMAGGSRPDPDPDLDPDPNPDPDLDSDPDLGPNPEPKPELDPDPVAAPVAPLAQFEMPSIEGCPELMQAVAMELGITAETIQVSIGNALALNPSIQPCQACATLIDAAAILRDGDGFRMAAMVQAFNTLAPADAPFTPETAASIATAFAEHIDDGSQYASVKEYIDAFVQYVAVLDIYFGAPVGDSVEFVMEKYGEGLAESGNANMIGYMQLWLAIPTSKISYNESPVSQTLQPLHKQVTVKSAGITANESPVSRTLQPLHKQATVKSAGITALSQSTSGKLSRVFGGAEVPGTAAVTLAALAAITLLGLLRSKRNR